MKIIKLIIILLIIIPLTFANIENIYKLYTPEKEMGVCLKMYMYNNYTRLDGWMLSNYGSESFVEFSCKFRYNAILHSHNATYCKFSQLDYKEFINSQYTISIVLCKNDYKIMHKEGYKIYEKTYKRSENK